MGRRRRRELEETKLSPYRDCETIGMPGKLIEKPSLLYIRGRLGKLKRVKRICKTFGIYPGLPPRHVLRRMLSKMLVLVPVEHILSGRGSRFWLVHLVFNRTPLTWYETIPARVIRSCFGNEWILRLCLTETDAWLLASTARAIAQCIEPLIAHVKLYAGVTLVDKQAQLVAPLQVLKACKKNNYKRLVYEEPYPWYYKVEAPV